jgi:hypothetical protein
MPLVLRIVLAWFAVSAVVSPVVGTMLAAGGRAEVRAARVRTTPAHPVRA